MIVCRKRLPCVSAIRTGLIAALILDLISSRGSDGVSTIDLDTNKRVNPSDKGPPDVTQHLLPLGAWRQALDFAFHSNQRTVSLANPG